MARNIFASIALTKLKNYILKINLKDGKPVKGIFIPIDPQNPNFLVKGREEKYYLNVKIYLRDDEDQYGNIGYIAHQAPSEIYKNATDQEKKKIQELEILGNIKEFTNNDNSGNMGTKTLTQKPEVISGADDTDDLPF